MDSLIDKTGKGIIPDYITKINDHAFYGCKGLTSTVIPDSVAHYESLKDLLKDGWNLD